MARCLIPAIAALLLAGTAAAPADEPALEEVLVTGEQPGPALWKVTSADHVLWILGDASPLPRKVKWRSKQFERRIADSQEVLLEYAYSAQPGKWQKVEYQGLQKLPGGMTLKDVIAPELYLRVAATRKQFGTSEQVEELRPFFAGSRIFMSAVRSMNLSAFSANLAVTRLAKKSGVKITALSVPGQTFEEFMTNLEHSSTVPCLEDLVEVVGDGGSGLRRLANAWSVGDIGTLRELAPSYVFRESHSPRKCFIAFYGGEEKANEYFSRRSEAWLAEAERALRENQSTMAVVSIAELFAADGYLATLLSKGYEVSEPD